MNKVVMYVVVFIIFVIIRIVASESGSPMGSFLSFFILAVLLTVGNMFVKNSDENKEMYNVEDDKNEDVKENTETKE